MSQNSIVSFQCSNCALTMFPRHTRCRACRGTEFVEIPLHEGTVLTHTRLTATRPGFAKELRLAVVELGNGVRVMGQIHGDQEVRSGSRVVVSWGSLSEKEGRVSSGFRFLIV